MERRNYSLVSLIGAMLGLLGSGRLFSRADVEEIKKRQDIVEYDVKNRVNVDQKLQEFDNRLKELERARTAERKTAPSAAKPAGKKP